MSVATVSMPLVTSCVGMVVLHLAKALCGGRLGEDSRRSVNPASSETPRTPTRASRTVRMHVPFMA